MKIFDHINFKAPIINTEVRRPFSVSIEESVAKNFILACKSKDIFVRETVVKLFEAFAKEALGEKTEQELKELKEKTNEDRRAIKPRG